MTESGVAGSAFVRDGVVAHADDFGIVDFRAHEVLAQGVAIDRQHVGVQQVEQLREQRAKAAGKIEILHQETPRRAQIGEARSAAGDFIELLQNQGNTSSRGHRDEMNDRIRRAAHGHVGDDRIVESVRGSTTPPAA